MLIKVKNLKVVIYICFSIVYLELLLRSSLFSFTMYNFSYTILSAISLGVITTFFINILPTKRRGVLISSIFFLISVSFFVFFIYYKIFQTPLSLYSVKGVGDAFEFRSIALNTISNNLLTSALYFLPTLLAVVLQNKFAFLNIKLPLKKLLSVVFLITFINYLFVISSPINSQLNNRLFNRSYNPSSNLQHLGLVYSVLLDFNRNVLGNEINLVSLIENEAPNNSIDNIENDNDEEEIKVEYNILDIDFDKLVKSTDNQQIKDLHQYFSRKAPTEKNEFTGKFADHNLIFITAEALHSIAIHPDITPTLYMMANEGFVFNNFYNPLWGVSTTDGEYVACIGLLPQTGVWSFSQSANNYLPFALGNQFSRLEYITFAYHNHTYTYYHRDRSHPNMGYTYFGVGNGLQMKNTWPRSDLEMINITMPDYINEERFHTYYMTVSGHFEYTFNDNYMSLKNKSHVEYLPYSERVRAYLAANLEFEFAMQALVSELEELGIAENTVIVISPDHHPYGLTMDEMNEISNEKLETIYDVYKSVFIIWKKGMEPIYVDKPCSSLDIIPTVSNLFGLEYDSRLLAGRDILSSSNSLVMFRNQSWLTEKGFYDADRDTFTPYLETIKPSYIEEINRAVKEKFHYSSQILVLDYYSHFKTIDDAN